MARALKGAEALAVGTTEAVEVFRHGNHLLVAYVASLLVVGASVLVAKCALAAFAVEISLAVALVVVFFVSLAIAAPGAPGYVGQFHAACRYALVAFAVPAATEAAGATFLHAVHTSYAVLIGAAALATIKLTWGRVGSPESAAGLQSLEGRNG